MFIRSKWKVGDRVMSNKGANMEVLRILPDDKGKRCAYYEVLFTEANVKVITHASMFQSGNIRNPEPVEFGEEFKYTCHKVVNNISSCFDRVKEKDLAKVTDSEIKNGDLEATARSRWTNMRSRCKDLPSSRNGMKRYLEVEVANEWSTKHCFDAFYTWFKNNYKLHGTRMDKDILSEPNSKRYSPETCCFIPDSLNILLGFFNNIPSDNHLDFNYKINGRVLSHKCKSYAEILRLHITCRIAWVRLWLRANSHLVEDYVVDALESKLQDIEDKCKSGFYDNFKRSPKYSIF